MRLVRGRGKEDGKALTWARVGCRAGGRRHQGSKWRWGVCDEHTCGRDPERGMSSSCPEHLANERIYSREVRRRRVLSTSFGPRCRC